VLFRADQLSGAWQKLADIPAAQVTRPVWVTNGPAANSSLFYRLVTPGN